jgi:hypothetical protein
MNEVHPLRLSDGIERKRRRVQARLDGRDPVALGLGEIVRDAQVLGSLELAGLDVSWDQVRAARRSEDPHDAIARLQLAMDSPGRAKPFAVTELVAWHGQIMGQRTRLRSDNIVRSYPPPASPGAFVAERLKMLEDWLIGDSGGELASSASAALLMARLVEILPFEEANGRAIRVAVSHALVCAGAGPPVLVGGDRPRLEACLQAAFQLDIEPLVRLLEEASERSFDVELQALENLR